MTTPCLDDTWMHMKRLYVFLVSVALPPGFVRHFITQLQTCSSASYLQYIHKRAHTHWSLWHLHMQTIGSRAPPLLPSCCCSVFQRLLRSTGDLSFLVGDFLSQPSKGGDGTPLCAQERGCLCPVGVSVVVPSQGWREAGNYVATNVRTILETVGGEGRIELLQRQKVQFM